MFSRHMVPAFKLSSCRKTAEMLLSMRLFKFVIKALSVRDSASDNSVVLS